MVENNSFIKIVLLHLLLIFFVILNVFNIGVIGFSNIFPLFDIAAIFYFSVYKKYISTWFVFLIGVWADSLSGTSLGVSSLCYISLISLFSFLDQKMYIRDNFKQIWQQFVVFCFLFLMLRYLISAMMDGVSYGVVDLFIRFVITSLLYVSLHKLFDYISQRLKEDF